jgi:phage terminase large subunit
MSAPVQLPHGFQLYAHQRELIAAFQAGARHLIACWHRAAGKGIASLALMVIAAFERPGTYVHVSPSFRKARENQWDAIDAHTGHRYLDAIPAQLIANKNENELSVTMRTKVPGKTSRLMWVTADDADDLRGLHPTGVVLDEFALYAGADALHIVRPALAASGGWLLITSTPNGVANHFTQVWKNAEAAGGGWWLSKKTIEDTQRHDGTPIIPAAHLVQERREGQREEWLQQEFYCQFTAALESSYYGDLLSVMEREGRICELPQRGDRPVIVGLDLGISDPTAEVFVHPPGLGDDFLHVTDYEQCEGLGLTEVLPRLRAKGYSITTWLAPHDAANRDLGTGQSRVSVALQLGVRLTIVPRVSVKDEAIDAVRRMLPRMKFERRCAKLIEALQAYARKWDEHTKTFRDRPEHSWASHACDALATFCLGYKERQALGLKRPAVIHARMASAPLRPMGRGAGGGPRYL